MIKCPQCKHAFSEIDQPCKKCDGGCFQWAAKDKFCTYELPSDFEITTHGNFKKTPCPRCNGNGKERSAANRNNRSRGSSNEYKAVHFFTEFWLKPDGGKYEFKRTPQSGGSDLAVGFDMAGDICTNAPMFPFHIECKRDQGWDFQQLMTTPDTAARLGSFIKQALSDAPKHRVPLLWLMHPGPSQPTFIMILKASMQQVPGVLCGRIKLDNHDIKYTIMSLKTFESLPQIYWTGVGGAYAQDQKDNA